jgi:MoxR-like ATPase
MDLVDNENAAVCNAAKVKEEGQEIGVTQQGEQTLLKYEDIYLTTEKDIVEWLHDVAHTSYELLQDLKDFASRRGNEAEGRDAEANTARAVGDHMTADECVEYVARTLMECCDPRICPTEYQALVACEEIQQNSLVMVDSEREIYQLPSGTPQGHETEESQLYTKLQRLLEKVAPISFHVAIHVLEQTLDVVIKTSKNIGYTNVDNQMDTLIKAMILFGKWIPDIAPHLHPVLEDCMSNVPASSWELLARRYNEALTQHHGSTIDKEGDVVMEDGTPQANKEVTTEIVHPLILQETLALSEAVYTLLDFFCYKRGEVQRIQSWGTWNFVFAMLPYQKALQKALWTCNASLQSDSLSKEGDGEGVYSLYDGFRYCYCWYTARAASLILDLRPPELQKYLQQYDEGKSHRQTAESLWFGGTSQLAHPQWFRQMKMEARNSGLSDQTSSAARIKEEGAEIASTCIPDPKVLHSSLLWIHPSLAQPIPGHLHYIHGSMAGVLQAKEQKTGVSVGSNTLVKSLSSSSSSGSHGLELIRTPTTARNMLRLSTALCLDPPPPLLVCGPRGSGKTALVRELARVCCGNGGGRENDTRVGVSDVKHHLLELHLDDDMDSKTLLGSMVATDIPGKFEWRPGPLTLAVQHGRWVLMEDVDRAPAEIVAALKPLWETRVLPVAGVKQRIHAHANFRFFGTCTTNNASNLSSYPRYHRRIPGPNRHLLTGLWRQVFVDPLPLEELGDMARGKFPTLPLSVVDACLQSYSSFDVSSHGDRECKAENRTNANDEDQDMVSEEVVQKRQELTNALVRCSPRPPSIRDFLKTCQRICSNIAFEPGTQFATESQRMLCLAEVVDIFVHAIPSVDLRRDFIVHAAAPLWKVTPRLAVTYVERRKPEWTITDERLELGRARIPVLHRKSHDQQSSSAPGTASQFSDTGHALRLMESIGVCIAQNEPTLLVGETGCGKTTLVQRLALASGRELVVQNLSLQTDSTDLLGGYRPVEVKHIARQLYMTFLELFVISFSKKQNMEFINYVTTSFEKHQWKRLSQCFRRAAKMGLNKFNEKEQQSSSLSLPVKDVSHIPKDMQKADSWYDFSQSAERFEKQRTATESGLAFAFTEGALVDAIKTGKWVLLDEINLASSETLQRLCGLLDDSSSSLTLTERGDSQALSRHVDFRLFAAMNPATDAGKKELPSSMRARFTEFYVDELTDAVELRSVAAKYLAGAIAVVGTSLESSDTVLKSVDTYLKCRALAEQVLVDGGRQKPRYTLRSLCRALSAAKRLIQQQALPVQRAMLEGFELAFEGPLDEASRKILQQSLGSTLGITLKKKELNHPGRRPGGKTAASDFVLVEPFWIRTGPEPSVDWKDITKNGVSKFVLTPSAAQHLRRLSRAVSAGTYPVLLEGPTSAGKTTLVQYLAARCGYRSVRINNHEHTDIQEYTGSYVANSDGRLQFQDGLLVQCLRRGDWIILDELNLAPSEVLEALNRLLDDNRELYLAETNEVIKPHPNFRLFATQNPSGAYGGRKPLSRAFRNRFVEVHMDDIPSEEMKLILQQRCGCPPTHAKLLVNVMIALRHRRSKSGVFRGKDGLITPRDLLRWAERGATSKQELAVEGFMLLGERLRDEDEKLMVKQVMEDTLKVTVNTEELYYGEDSENRRVFEDISAKAGRAIAPTKPLLRMLQIVRRCIAQKEPVLLCGDTGTGKTTLVQLMGLLLERELHMVNCHATMETSDVLGGLRPLRGRTAILQNLVHAARDFVSQWPIPVGDKPSVLEQDSAFDDVSDCATVVYNFAKTLWESRGSLSPSRRTNDKDGGSESSSGSREAKRRKVADPETLNPLWQNIHSFYSRYNSIFEWSDGPLVTAMKQGHLFMLDEINLADDAVLERLNSVLEPSRQLTLAEKGGDGGVEGDNEKSAIVEAHTDFLFFATMNPGDDFGKRELSPALRSRFTEVWVPQMTDREDVDHVLSRQLNLSTTKHEKSELDQLRAPMLDYIDWFKGYCSSSTSPFADMTLSVRDVQTWAAFLSQMYTKGSKGYETSSKGEQQFLWRSYAHGAALMHLDGLGLGTGLSSHDASTLREAAVQFISQQAAGHNDDSENTGKSLQGIMAHDVFSEPCHFGFENGEFGKDPFFIPLGPVSLPDKLNFSMSAPMTASNLQRVLRAMQLTRPILLEGSPGVGKTSLIAALAAASGHRLVRINLSEQTDISDLMGSDLPDPTASESGGAAFKWCDGVFLSALRRGDWVLLDELNLASQSVLEGLNSCLDHRSQVFIPELGKTFDCPPTFKVFAAQNPLAQGGGRKGLPKSFLNRFTKVFIEALLPDDLNIIVCARFPCIPPTIVSKMVEFASAVHRDVVELKKYGHIGSPWEFNLRDVARWCELMMTEERVLGEADAVAFVDVIFQQRMRTFRDRRALAQTCLEIFGCDPSLKYQCSFLISEDAVNIGNAVIQRLAYPFRPSGHQPPLQGCDVPFARSLLSPMEAVARCVNQKWPCLLVGPASSGKSMLLRGMAYAVNAHLEEVALTPSTDVTELIGCFEQRDSAVLEQELMQTLDRLLNLCLHSGRSADQVYTQIQEARLRFQKLRLTTSGSQTQLSSVRGAQEDIRMIVEACSQHATHVGGHDAFSAEIRSATECFTAIFRQSSTDDDIASNLFRWIDGILVTAMEQGYWLHLENVNLCPASVLDRLNPLLEDDGKLVLSECLVSDKDKGESGQKVVKPHPNFRIFLSMNAEMGDVSRAMRNRCIEVCILPAQAKEVPRECLDEASLQNTYDGFEALSASDVGSMVLAQEALTLDVKDGEQATVTGEEQRTYKDIINFSHLSRGLRSRGLSLASSIEDSFSLVYGTEWREASQESMYCAPSESGDLSFMVPGVNIRKWAINPMHANEIANLRLQNVLSNNELSNSVALKTLLSGPRSTISEGIQSIVAMMPKKIAMDDLSQDIFRPYSAFILSTRCVRMWSQVEGLLSGSDNEFSNAMRFMQSIDRRIRSIKSDDANMEIDGNGNSDPLLDNLLLSRLPQMLIEFFVYSGMKENANALADKSLSAIQTSYGVHIGAIDASEISCPLTPLLYPLLENMDKLLLHLVIDIDAQAFLAKDSIESKVRDLVSKRDQFWQFLHRALYDYQQNSSLIAFEESSFYVHCRWLSKSFGHLQKSCSDVPMGDVVLYLAAVQRSLQDMMSALTNLSGGTLSFSNDFWKKSGHPLIPSTFEAWETRLLLMQMAQSAQVFQRQASTGDGSFGGVNAASSNSTVSLDLLLAENHPWLYMPQELKSELVSALCMIQWAATDEAARGTASRRTKVPGEILRASAYYREKLGDVKKTFLMERKEAVLDLAIRSVDNVMSTDELELISTRALEIKTFPVNDKDMTLRLMEKYGALQTSQLVFMWCVAEEGAVLNELSLCLMAALDEGAKDFLFEMKKCLHRAKNFVQQALSNPLWSADHLRSYQTFVWALEDDKVTASEVRHLLRSLMPTMMHLHQEHLWCKAFNGLDCISDEIKSSSFLLQNTTGTSDSMELESSHGGAAKSRQSACEGPVRLRHPLADALLFRLNGNVAMLGSSSSTRSIPVPFTTIENCTTRKLQKKVLANSLSSLSFHKNETGETVIIKLLFVDVLLSLSSHFEDPESVQLVAKRIAEDDVDNLSLAAVRLREIIPTCYHDGLKSMAISVVYPLVDRLVAAARLPEESQDKRTELGLALVYVGLLRLQLSLPPSPLDPARRPAAKVQQIEERGQILYRDLLVRRADKRVNRNEIVSYDSSTGAIVEECQVLNRKHDKQVSKLVARPDTAPAFQSFYREVHRFSMATGALSEVVSLASGLANREEKAGMARRLTQESNWQSTAHAFCQRLSQYYLTYEDVAVPMTNSIREIQRGLRDLAMMAGDEVKASEKDQKVQTMTRVLMQYPQRADSNECDIQQHVADPTVGGRIQDQIIKMQGSTETQALQFVKQCKLSCLVASLGILQKKVQLEGGFHEHEGVDRISQLFRRLVDLCDGQNGDSPDRSIEERTDIAEEEEAMFRMQFPNHAKEFTSIVEAAEMAVYDDDPNPTDENEADESNESSNVSLDLGADDVSLLCDIHQGLFLTQQEGIDDSSRIRLFKWCYDAASRLGRAIEWVDGASLGVQSVGGHLMGIQQSYHLCNGTLSPMIWKMPSSDSKSGNLDFYNDANPVEVSKAGPLLRDLTCRLAQLLNAFPGNAILIAVAQVSERVSQLNLENVPLGKVVTGFEIILKKAQEWEQHASQHVKLGATLKAASSQVAMWRQLELGSWSSLLDIRERRYSISAKRHWFSLYRLVHGTFRTADSGVGEIASTSETVARLNFACPPLWLTRGMGASKGLAPSIITAQVGRDPTLVEFVKTADSLILASGIGEFRARLDLILSFSRDLRVECEHLPIAERSTSQFSSRLLLSRLLHSVWAYYSHFSPSIEMKVREVKGPIEKKLKDEVKLAKWDEQSYYSLAESSDKSHRKLNKHLRAYDAGLETTVSSVLEEILSKGGRNKDDGDGPSTKVPSAKAMFPELEISSNAEKQGQTTIPFFFTSSVKDDCPEAVAALTDDKYLIGMKRYGTKVSRFLADMEKQAMDSADAGAEQVEELTSTIFERIDFLRGDKVTTPMKQRALTDLFKCLKDEGFSSLKWSVPSEMRDMHHVLQIPVPELEDGVARLIDGSSLHKGEKYFQQSCAEIFRLRSEISLFGSQYMTQRELSLMVGYCESAFFCVCQQRNLIACLVKDVSDTYKTLRSLESAGNLELGQTALVAQVLSFERNLSYAKESMQQLVLLIRLNSEMEDDPAKSSIMRDAVAECVESVETLAKAQTERPLNGIDEGNRFVTVKRVDSIKSAAVSIEKIEESLRNLARECGKVQCLPIEVFGNTFSALEEARESCISCQTKEGNILIEQYNASNEVRDGLVTVSSTVQASLVTVQKLLEFKKPVAAKEDVAGDEEEISIMNRHRGMIHEWSCLNPRKNVSLLRDLAQNLSSVFASTGGDVEPSQRAAFASLVLQASSIARQLHIYCLQQLERTMRFYASSAKFNYVLVRVFRTLAAKGFCSDKTQEKEGDGSGDGDVEGMTFEDDVEGTGMGEGEGKEDVTDQIENEEQLLGLKGDDENNDENKSGDQKQLDEKEAETGMEMENDFDGEMYDMPEKQEEDENKPPDNGDDEEELDREMGDDDSPNDDVVDEKLWDKDDDEEEEPQNQDEKFEKDSKVAGEALEDEMRTKDDDEGEGKAKDGDDAEEHQNDVQEEKNDPESKVRVCNCWGALASLFWSEFQLLLTILPCFFFSRV